jgi:predicted O-methyltransferase YrrM
MAVRYLQIYEIIARHKPNSIIEIGTWNGERALQMVRTVLKYVPKVHYIGYDLFDIDCLDIHKREHNWDPECQKVNNLYKPPLSVKEIETKFSRSGLNFTWELTKGDTRETLKDKNYEEDFVFIDGGHTIETIANDYEHVKNCKVVLFDDYHINSDTVDVIGCNQLVDSLDEEIYDVKIYPSNDIINGTKTTIHLVEVVKK